MKFSHKINECIEGTHNGTNATSQRQQNTCKTNFTQIYLVLCFNLNR
jgi:hypothetical protein